MIHINYLCIKNMLFPIVLTHVFQENTGMYTMDLL